MSLREEREKIEKNSNEGPASTAALRMLNHRFRSPLHAALSGLDLLLTRQLPGDTTDVLGGVRSSLLALADTLDDLTLSSTVLNGDFAVEPVPQEIDSVLDEMLRSLDLAIFAKQAGIIKERTKGVPRPILLDRERFQRAFRSVLLSFAPQLPFGMKLYVRTVFVTYATRIEVSTAPEVIIFLRCHIMNSLFNRS